MSAPKQQTTAHVEVPEEHDDGVAHEVIHDIGNAIGWWPLLIIIGIGVGVGFRKRIKNWIMKA